MKIIDAHIHFSKIYSFKETAEKISFVNYTGSGLENEFEEAGITLAIGMGVTEKEAWGFPDQASPNPMGLDLEYKAPDIVACCVGINPVKLEANTGKELDNIEMELLRPDVVGIKIYAGYYPYCVYDKVYEPVYKLSEKYNLAVVIHGGATYSDRALLKYSHPLAVDELAVNHRNINFVIAHLGDPWVMDTAAIVAKNPNVYADLSGLIVADGPQIQSQSKNRLAMDHIMQALIYAGNYKKFLFGSDWPLAPVKPYIEYVKDLVPEEFHEDVFLKNAINVFPKLEQFLWMIYNSQKQI